MDKSVSHFAHETVLLDEAVEALAIEGARAQGIFVDGTFGRGGHSRAILARLGDDARLIVLDKDPVAIAEASRIGDARIAVIHDSFAVLDEVLAHLGITGIQGVLLDLGVSSPQLDDASRGFSFRHDGPLDMRMDPTRGESAAQWLARASQDEMREVIRDYGEERYALQVAKAIVARRSERPISTTRELAALVAGAVRSREKGQDPATRTFQAIRIHINQELAGLEQGLKAAMDALAPGGRLVVISFHSLEDRIVKRFLQLQSRPDEPPLRLPVRAVDLPRPRVRIIGRTVPGSEETRRNPRARSAVMRVAEKLDEGLSA